MYRKITPQKVQHPDGYIVQVADRSHVEYIEGTNCAVVEVEFSSVTGVYKNTLKVWNESKVEREVILGRIVAGLKAMGCKVELC